MNASRAGGADGLMDVLSYPSKKCQKIFCFIFCCIKICTDDGDGDGWGTMPKID